MSNIGTKKIVNLLGYIAMCSVAVALVIRFTLARVFPNISADIIYWCNTISFIFSLIVTVVVGFFYAKSKRSKTFLVVYVIALLVIICFYFVW